MGGGSVVSAALCNWQGYCTKKNSSTWTCCRLGFHEQLELGYKMYISSRQVAQQYSSH